MRRTTPMMVILALFVLSVALSAPAFARDLPCKGLSTTKIVHAQVAQGTFGTFTDNEDNAGSGQPDGDMGGSEPPCIFNDDPIHPIEFNIDIGGTVPAGMTLKVYAYDVDSPEESDVVFINGHRLGELVGANDVDSTTPFTVPGALLHTGNNLVQIYVDQYGVSQWCAAVYGAELVTSEPIPAASHSGLLILAGLIALAAVAILVKMKF